MNNREKFGTRLGFILISAGCAIGLGNVWRFPYITGEYGGGAFVLIYLIFLIILGLPIMAMEFATGRASQKGIARSFDTLEPEGSKWHIYKWFAVVGNILLMMFYTVVAGWFLNYSVKMASGQFVGATTESTAAVFTGMLANPGELAFWTLLVVAVGAVVCSLGVQKGIEGVTKVMMLGLLALILALVVRSVTLGGSAIDGIAFYLMPDFSKIFSDFNTAGEAIYAAMGQSFFTLSVGIGSMAIFGSYIGKDRALFGEAMTIGILDTTVALLAGLIIFPSCFAFGIEPGSGAGLAFITLPNVFEQMPLGQLWGTMFFLFMACAALSTVIAVFENIIAFGMDQWGWSRKKSSLVTGVAIAILAMPAVLGMDPALGNYLPIGGTVDGLEDFIVSNNLLPIGSLVFLMFCLHKRGWGWENFLAEANTGSGLKFPRWLYYWMKFGAPVLIIFILIMGWIPTIQGLLA
ncbi:MAG: sodium-dependent transporter [Eggerthellales bacterium]|nr:sodium-dependent transporter [Eggerthellales bacterium]